MSLTILDRALIIAQHELDAMRRGDVDDAANFFEERGKLINQAKHTKDEDKVEDYRVKLTALIGYHHLIHEEGTMLLNQIRASLIQTKSHSKVARSYVINQIEPMRREKVAGKP